MSTKSKQQCTGHLNDSRPRKQLPAPERQRAPAQRSAAWPPVCAPLRTAPHLSRRATVCHPSPTARRTANPKTLTENRTLAHGRLALAQCPAAAQDGAVRKLSVPQHCSCPLQARWRAPAPCPQAPLPLPLAPQHPRLSHRPKRTRTHPHHLINWQFSHSRSALTYALACMKFASCAIFETAITGMLQVEQREVTVMCVLTQAALEAACRNWSAKNQASMHKLS
jgi:hypothetical protein